MSSSNLFTVVAADARAVVAGITSALKWFGNEASQAVAWIDKSAPGAQQALAVLFQAADAAATELEGQTAAGFADIVSNAVAEAGGAIANLISASGLDLTTKAVLTAADVATVTAAEGIARNAISVATAKLLGDTAPAAATQTSVAATAASSAAPASPQL